MRTLLLLALCALSGFAQATNNECRGDCGPKPDVNNHYQDQTQGQGQAQGQDQGQAQGQHQSADATAVAGAIAVSGSAASADNTNLVSNRNDVDVNTSDYNANLNKNDNTNVAYGGDGGRGGAGGAGGEGGSAVQGQSQSSDNSNSSNNSSSQNVTFEGTGEAKHTNKYGNNVSAYAPAIYSSSACTAGGVSGGASGMGFGIALGGAKQDPQCQIRENARILSGLDANLAILYLCANPGVDIGAVLGTACKPADPLPPVVIVPDPPVIDQPIEVVSDVKGR